MNGAYYLGQRPADMLQRWQSNVRRAFVELIQNKTRHPLAVKPNAELEELLNRINARKSQFSVRRLQLLIDELAKGMTKAEIRNRFEAARKAAHKATREAAREAAGVGGAVFQIRDLRRKAGQDLRRQVGLEVTQALLGHSSVAMTEHYMSGVHR